MNILLYCFVSFLYCALAVHAGWQQRKTQSKQALPRMGISLHHGILLLTLIMHGVLLHQTVFAEDGFHFGFAYALSAMFWLGVIFYWVESFTLHLSGLPMLLLPLAGVTLWLPWLFPGGKDFIAADAWGFRLHLASAILASSLLMIVALHAILMTAQERHLHRALSSQAQNTIWRRFLDGLPPLLTMEKMLFRMLLVGFILLTLTLISGILFAEIIWHRAFKLDHKTLFAVLSWLIFGALLIGRWGYGWRGRKALRWTLAGFAALILAYIGSRFVLEVILHRI